MEYEIHPKPSPEERAAIVAALERIAADERAPRESAWWRAGIRENVEADE